MATPGNAIATLPNLSGEVSSGGTLAPRNITEAFDFAQMLLISGMLPKPYIGAKPETIVVVLQFGYEVGLQPMQALQGIANINGMPSLWGDAALGLVRGSGLLEYIVEDDFNTIRANKMATCRIKRRNEPEVIRTFSLEDAKEAKIADNAVWKTYPQRMMQMRARGFALRDVFPDVMKGLILADEAQDYPVIDASNAVQQQQTAKSGPDSSGKAREPEQAKVVDQKPAEATAAKQEAPEQQPQNGNVTIDQARQFYQAYVHTGWTVDDSKKFLQERFGVTDSRLIPAARFAEAMRWARNEPENMDAEPCDQ